MVTKKLNPDHIPQLQDERMRGIAAKQILENDVFKAVIDDRWHRLIESWINTAPDDVRSREWFHQQAVAQRALIKGITGAIGTGNLASISLDEPITQPKRRSRNG